MNRLLKQRADAVAAAIQKLPRPVNALLVVFSMGYAVMPWHFIPIVGQVDLALVAWFAWQNLKALFRAAEVEPETLPPSGLKEVVDVRST